MEIHNITSGEVGLIIDESNEDKVVVLQYDNSNPLTKEVLIETLQKVTEEMNAPPTEIETEELEVPPIENEIETEELDIPPLIENEVEIEDLDIPSIEIEDTN